MSPLSAAKLIERSDANQGRSDNLGSQESQPNPVANDLRMNLLMDCQRLNAVEGARG